MQLSFITTLLEQRLLINDSKKARLFCLMIDNFGVLEFQKHKGESLQLTKGPLTEAHHHTPSIKFFLIGTKI